jgi:hypothetical protein
MIIGGTCDSTGRRQNQEPIAKDASGLFALWRRLLEHGAADDGIASRRPSGGFKPESHEDLPYRAR